MELHVVDSTTGDVYLVALTGSIYGQAPTGGVPTVTGNNITLTASEGGIGYLSPIVNYLAIDSQNFAPGVVTANALDGIYLVETAGRVGDMDVNVVDSVTGDVALITLAGSILDADNGTTTNVTANNLDLIAHGGGIGPPRPTGPRTSSSTPTTTPATGSTSWPTPRRHPPGPATPTTAYTYPDPGRHEHHQGRVGLRQHPADLRQLEPGPGQPEPPGRRHHSGRGHHPDRRSHRGPRRRPAPGGQQREHAHRQPHPGGHRGDLRRLRTPERQPSATPAASSTTGGRSPATPPTSTAATRAPTVSTSSTPTWAARPTSSAPVSPPPRWPSRGTPSSSTSSRP